MANGEHRITASVPSGPPATMKKPEPPSRQSQPTHYEVLQVSLKASGDDIKASYKKAVLLHHPDKRRQRRRLDAKEHDGDADDSTFKRIQAAWECLRDTEQRQSYDEELWLQEKRLSSHVCSAIKLERTDCREEFVSSLGDYTLIYTCRCGQEIDTAEVIVEADVDDGDNDDPESDLITCVGCSLVYDTSALWQEDGEGA